MSRTVLLYPLSTEKAVRLMETHNTLLFVVDKAATKPQIRAAVMDHFDVVVADVRTLVTPRGLKRAFVRLGGTSVASDVMAQLGLG